MVPVLGLIDVKLWDVNVFSLPGGLVIWQITPLDQVVDTVLPVNTWAETHNICILFYIFYFEAAFV